MRRSNEAPLIERLMEALNLELDIDTDCVECDNYGDFILKPHFRRAQAQSVVDLLKELRNET